MIKPYFETDNGKLYHGDCLDILSQINDKIDLILTDPPYGINWKCNYSEWITKSSTTQGGRSLKSYPQIIGDDKPFNSDIFMKYNIKIFWGLPYFLKDLNNGSILVWHKRNNSKFLGQAEAGWMSKGNGVYIYYEPVEKQQKERCHPTQKPVGLMVWSINHSKTSGIVCDPYLGSGTTAIACERLNRRWIGIEISKEYCNIAVNRIKKETAQYKMDLTYLDGGK